VQAAPQKIAKGDAPFVLSLQRTRDILADLGAWRAAGQAPGPVLVGFAAETQDLLARARDKRARKQVDLVVANDVSQPDRGFDAATNAVTLVSEDDERQVPLQSKERVASAILDRVEQLLAARRGAPADVTA
jgi:phosphopantothenoylcysteine decarboxylase/phosphopantothenate--cysteine ligase